MELYVKEKAFSLETNNDSPLKMPVKGKMYVIKRSKYLTD